MRLESQKYLFDILEALNFITEFCADETRERYAESVLLRSAVERQFVIAGEALSQLGKTCGNRGCTDKTGSHQRFQVVYPVR